MLIRYSIKNPHPIPCPKGRAMWCVLWIFVRTPCCIELVPTLQQNRSCLAHPMRQNPHSWPKLIRFEGGIIHLPLIVITHQYFLWKNCLPYQAGICYVIIRITKVVVQYITRIIHISSSSVVFCRIRCLSVFLLYTQPVWNRNITIFYESSP